MKINWGWKMLYWLLIGTVGEQRPDEMTPASTQPTITGPDAMEHVHRAALWSSRS